MRKKKTLFVTNLKKAEAQAFIQEIFKLKEMLDIDYQQMGKEASLSVDALYRLKCLWLRDEVKQKILTFELANHLVKFWNKHLDIEEPESSETSISFEVVALMLKKDGLKKTVMLLKHRDKLSVLKKYLKTLSSAKLADLL